jgi:hypothetical protein
MSDSFSLLCPVLQLGAVYKTRESNKNKMPQSYLLAAGDAAGAVAGDVAGGGAGC